MWGTALLYSGIAAIIFAALMVVYDVISSDGEGIVASIFTAVTYFGVMTAATAGWLYVSAPALTYSAHWQMVFTYLLAMLIFAGLRATVSLDSVPVPAGIVGTALIVWVLVGAWQSTFNPWGQDQANHLAKLANVVQEAPGAYPETDTEHISLMPKEAAAFKADNALSQVSGKNTNLSTLYSAGSPNKQSINKHLYWVFPLKLGGTNAARRVKYIVPGYIVVDAEDPEAAPKLKLGYKMRYTPGARADHSIRRLMYAKYPEYVLDDLTLEINDDWQPYFTAALSKPAYTFGPTIPDAMIVVDPQTGKITKYKLGHAPGWVDRVYSASDAKQLLNWWGEWGAGEKDAPWKNGILAKEGAANRYKVSGDPVLVYTKDKGGSHPEWQMLMTSYRTDNSATYVALFDARVARVRLYRVPNLHIEKAAQAAFDSASWAKNKFQSTEPALHKIYGRLTWVTGYINTNDGEAAENQSLQGVGLVAADNTQGADVNAGTDQADVFLSYQEWLSSSRGSGSPGADSKTVTIEATVEHVSSVVRNGNTGFYLILKEAPNQVFLGQVDRDTVELPFVVVGDKVRITYNDHAETVVNILSIDDLAFQVGVGGKTSGN